MQAAFLLTEEMVQNHNAMAKGIANTKDGGRLYPT